MHKTRYNALRLTLALSPRGPLLVKSGGLSANPTLPDMQFVRTYRAGVGETLYIPGSSLKGAVRGFAEKVLRTINQPDSWRWACPTFPDEEQSCAKQLKDEENSATIYHNSCGACRLFGHTRLKGRAAFTDFLPAEEIKTEIRYGVAISRLSHAVAQGPFEMEIAVAGAFKGHLVLENYEIWQLGLLAMTLEAMNQGWMKVGFGKNRGFGEVDVMVKEAQVDEAIGDDTVQNGLRGLAAFVTQDERDAYGLAVPERLEGLPQPTQTVDLGLYVRRVYDAQGWQVITQRAIEALRTG